MKFLHSKNFLNVYYWFLCIFLVINFYLLLKVVYVLYFLYGLGADKVTSFGQVVPYLLVAFVIIIIFGFYLYITVISTIATYKLRHNEQINKFQKIAGILFPVVTVPLYILFFIVNFFTTITSPIILFVEISVLWTVFSYFLFYDNPIKFIHSKKILDIYYWFQIIFLTISFYSLINFIYMFFTQTVLFEQLMPYLSLVIIVINFYIAFISTITTYKLSHNEQVSKFQKIATILFPVITILFYSFLITVYTQIFIASIFYTILSVAIFALACILRKFLSK